MITAIADTSFVVSIANTTDRRHIDCRAVYEQEDAIGLPQSTLAEIAYILYRETGSRATAQFFEEFHLTKFELIALESIDIFRAAQLLRRYSDTRLDFVDASIVAVTERLDLDKTLTLDQRDFRLVRPRHTAHFNISPT